MLVFIIAAVYLFINAIQYENGMNITSWALLLFTISGIVGVYREVKPKE
ncbi:hypothetical protein [Guptibacillus hwajinpoensis]